MVFTYPWFLAGLVAVAVPIAIHLFELRRPQRVLFSNVEFLREAKLVTARQRRVKHWLVLLCRIGLVCFLALLFAQPFIPAPQGKDKTGDVEVLLDNTPSMKQRAARTEGALLDYAIEQATELPLAFPTTTRYSLLPEAQKALSGAEYRSAVEQIQIDGQKGSLSTSLASMQGRGQKKELPLFIFSDFQKKGFSSQSVAELDTTRQVFLVPLVGQQEANVFVDSVWVDDAFIRRNADVELNIRLRNGGTQDAAECQARLFIGKQQAAVFQVQVLAQQATTTRVRVRLSEATTQACHIEVDDFPVDFDNTYYFTLQPASQISVVEVAADDQLNRLYGNEPLFEYKHVQPQIADYRTLAGANLIILREAFPLSVGLREGIRKAVQEGATVVIVPSAVDRSRSEYSAFFRELGLGPLQWLQQPGSGPVLQEVAMPSSQNTFFRDVFAGINRQAAMPKAAPVLRWARSGTDVLRMRSGEEYLAGFSSGLGTVYVFAAPLSAPYSDFTQHALFVPVMYRLAMLSYQQEQQPAYRLNQQRVALRLSKAPEGKAGEAVYRLVQDSLVYIPAQRRQGQILYMDVPLGMQKPGLYALQRGNQTLATLAFNFDKRESDLRSYSVAELKQMIGPNRPNVHVYETGEGQTVAARYKADRVGVPLWRYCLWGALACLFLEGILLRWKRRAAPEQEPLAA
ncbi:BatA domain-containing protein [Hymenobacter sp. DG01]|uniref:BatA domain-containing protein n=1 Tax=Hymenobacter sp. DG01 TaxID=2584940 RepID=UPI0015DFCA7C|nr:BatA domain-containing protein [Hymenobacter sp. DG01]